MSIETVDPQNALEVLKAAEAWLLDPAHWTRDLNWADAEGESTDDRTRVASACGMGALAFVAGTESPTRYYGEAPRALRRAADRLYPSAFGPRSVNDGPDGYDRIMAAYRLAIETLEAP